MIRYILAFFVAIPLGCLTSAIEGGLLGAIGGAFFGGLAWLLGVPDPGGTFVRVFLIFGGLTFVASFLYKMIKMCRIIADQSTKQLHG